MKKIRFVVPCTFFLLLFSGILLRLFLLSCGGTTRETAVFHGNYSIAITTQRGTIYDRNRTPLVNTSAEHIAAVLPLRNAAAQLKALIPHVYSSATVLAQMELGKPFLTRVRSSSILAPGIKVVDIRTRYSKNSVAPHVIGYVGSDGKGLSGIEKAFDSQLRRDAQTITAHFAVDALGRTLKGVPVSISKTGSSSKSGVVLTLQKNIQQFAQKAAEKNLKSGAALVMDVKNGDILACVSVPSYSQNNIAASLNVSDSPLINRAFTAYNVGSVFKIVLAARALETGVSPDLAYTCKGKISVAGKKFTCEKVHGRLSMEMAIAESCNTYFISLGRRLGGAGILSMARALGFGTKLRLAPGLYSAAGNLPSEKSLAVPAALANFSFGQGTLMATPVQVARMICAVANDGLMPTPRLVLSLVNGSGKTTTAYSSAAPTRVFSSETAALLRKFLVKTVEDGTGKAAKPSAGGAGGKTSTAQTGWVKNGKTMTQAWFAGFYPAQSPRYAIVVVVENGISGGSSAAPVFRQIADGLAARGLAG